MLELIIWLLGTISVGTIACLLGKRFGVEYLIGMFVGAIVIANVAVSKIITIGPFTATAALVVYSITFLLTDTISEFWGKKEAEKAIWSGFLALVMYAFVTQMAIKLQPAGFWEGQEAFVFIFGSSIRIVFASFVAYIIAQNHDVWAYHLIMKYTGRKHLWLRNNISTWVSQTIDTVVFVTIAFYGILPIWDMIWSVVVLKVIIAVIDTPFLYLIRWYYEGFKPKWKRKPVPIDVPGM